MQWLNKIVDQVIAANPDGEILIESGGSPSGTHHLGHLRELITSDAVLLELKRRGRQARHIYFVDDLDALRKVPINISPDFETQLGKPLCSVPAPDNSHKSYADFFLQGLIDASAALGMEMEFIRSHLKYQEGFFVPAIEKCLEHITQARLVLETISGHKLGPEWSPVQVNEDGYLKKRPFIKIDKDNKVLHYLDKDGVERTTSYEQGEVKLDWRLDWPARWWLLRVNIEAFGRDHATKGGSYDTGVALMKDVYNAPAPLPVPYDFVNLAGDTKKMSASKGTGLSAEDIVQALPPEIVRYFMLRYAPSKRLYFDPANGVSQLIDDFAALLAKEDKSEADQQLIEISTNKIESTVSNIPFSHLVASYQAALKDREKTIDIIQRTEHAEIAGAQREIVLKELKFIDQWLNRWAPEDVKFELRQTVDPSEFNDDEKDYLGNLAAKISAAPETADGEWFHKAVYEFRESLDWEPKKLFEVLYRLLIGKNSGPRAGWFLSTLPKDWLIKRLRLEA